MIDPAMLAATAYSHAIRDIFPRQLTFASAVVLLVVALALIFAGRHIIKALAFVAVGLVVAAVGAVFGLAIFGILGLLVGGVIGFILGGLLSLVLLPVAIGIAIGVIAYDLAQLLAHIYILSIILGIIFFVIGIVLSSKILALASAVFGALLLFDVAIFFQAPELIAALIAIVLGAVGFWAQGGFAHRQGAPFVQTRIIPPRPPPSYAATEDSKYCSKCGTRMPRSAEYCPSCGARQ